MDNLKAVKIFCDGSSLGNGRAHPRGAAVALLGYRGLWRAVGEYLGEATNQQAEIVAAALGLETLTQPCRVHLSTDSNYVVQTMKGNFKRKTNHEWWARLDAAARPHQVTWEWIKGHAGHPIQEVVDETARRVATLGQADETLLYEAAAQLTGQE